MVEVQKPFLIIAEDGLSASIVRTLIDVGNNKVYMAVAGSYQNIPSMIRTYQINHPGEFNYIAVFNANSDDDFIWEEKNTHGEKFIPCRKINGKYWHILFSQQYRNGAAFTTNGYCKHGRDNGHLEEKCSGNEAISNYR